MSSEDEYDDSESSEESVSSDGTVVSENVYAWGKKAPKKGTGSSKRPIERARRTGIVHLNLTSAYGNRNGWGVREGLRELLQNLYVTLLMRKV